MNITANYYVSGNSTVKIRTLLQIIAMENTGG